MTRKKKADKIIRLMVAVEIFEADEEAFRMAVGGYTPDPTIWSPTTDEWLEAMDPSHSPEG